MAKNLKKLLDDVRNDLNGDGCIEDTFEVSGHKVRMRLMNEEEQNWRNGNIIMMNKMSAISSFRLPTLAIGIRSFDDMDVFEFFAEEWDRLDASVREELNKTSKYTHKYFAAEHMMEFLSQWSPEAVNKLWEKWQELESRREEAVAAVKKSSGESSEKVKNPNMTEFSPFGEAK